jgi:uncharacterized protein YqgC (DUF456 family)
VWRFQNLQGGVTVVLSILMTVVGAALVLVGFIGCVIPAIPGPILAFAALILISIPGTWALMPLWVLILLGVIAVAATVLDNVLPALSSKKAGAGRAGVWGSVIGMIGGSFVIPPIGTILGAFVGALLGEMIFNRENKSPLKAALGVFKGTLLAMLIKLAATGVIAYQFVISAIRLFR